MIFHERFEGCESLKDRYFVVVCNGVPEVECFTTTTKEHGRRNSKLATEFCEIAEHESCLPKRCFVDFRNIYPFDDIALSSKLRSKSVKYLGQLPHGVLRRIRDGLSRCRSLSLVQKERLLAAIDDAAV